jgi:anthranilate synthase/aminodeoxychorismate synthase-like glutamine amidotransferase
LNLQKKILLVDNHDSFTYNIWDYLSILGVEVEVLRIEKITDGDFAKFDGIVLSPGPGHPVNLPELKKIVQFISTRFPVLGICLGFQALALEFGFEVEKGNPTHGKCCQIEKIHEGKLIQGLPNEFEVVRYHSLVVKKLGNPLIPLLQTKTGEIMAFEHKNLPLAGIQYHPEAHLTQFGFEVLKNWLSFC